MRYLYTLFILLGSITLQLNAQTSVWGGVGPNWKYDVIHQTGLGIYEIGVINDTVIQGRSCQVLESKEHRFSYPNPPFGEIEFQGTHSKPTNITCVSGDTVFHYRDGKFYVLYNFGANIGDTWDLGYDSSALGQACTTSVVEVVDTGHIVKSGRRFRYLDIKMTDSNFSFGFGGRIYETLGNQYFMFPTFGIGCFGGVPESPSFVLKCYSDSASSLSFKGFNDMYGIWIDTCEINFFVGEEEYLKENKIDVYPNPFGSTISIELDEVILNGIPELHDLNGKRINIEYEYQRDRMIIETRVLNPGIYFLTLKLTDGYLKTFKLFKE